MLEAVVMLLIYVVALVLVVYLIVWVLGECGIPLPPKVIRLLFVIVGLIVLLLLIRLLFGHGVLVLP